MHSILWSKLYSLGISAKFIRILKYIYDHAAFSVKIDDIFSKNFDITEGVLQGEVLSPLIFVLFICDFELFLRNRGMEGVNIDGYVDLLQLLYADDAVALTISPVRMQRLICLINEYCMINRLVVNTDKTKIVHFRRGGRCNDTIFYMNNHVIETVDSYMYLGVKFVSSSLGRGATLNAISKARSAIGAAMQLLSNCKTDSWECKVKIFESTIASTLLYSAQV